MLTPAKLYTDPKLVKGSSAWYIEFNFWNGKVRFRFEENIFEVEFVRNSKGVINRGIFIPHFFKE